MSHQDDVERLITDNSRRLQKLQEKKARLGINVPPEILTEIEDIEAEVERLQTELNVIKDGDVEAFESTSQGKIDLVTFVPLSSKVDGVGRKSRKARVKDKLTDYLTVDQNIKLNHIRQYTTDLWAHGTPMHPLFTLHGAQHAQQVELILSHILAPEHQRLDEMFHSEQLFYLLASAWLHDTGMIWPPTEEEKRIASEQRISISEWIRKVHNERSYKYVTDHASELHLEPVEANTIGLICQAHRGKNLTSDPRLSTDYLNTRLSGALIRVADELDISIARTPPQLMELHWNEMDSASRWHWLKHWCVLRADPHHEELKDERPIILQLTYQFTIRLPNPRYQVPFWDRVIRPIREVIEEQGVDSILRQKHLAIGHRSFEHVIFLSNDTLPDGTKLEECLNDLLMSGAFLLSDVVMRHLDELRSKNPAVAAILQRQCRRLTNTVLCLTDASIKMGDILGQYLSTLITSNTLLAVENTHERFGDIIRQMLKEPQFQENISADAEKEWLNLLEMGRRLMIFVIGDEGDRRAQLWHIFAQLETESNDLLGWVATKDASASLRQLAISLLAKKGTPEFCEVVLEATKDQNAEVRAEAVKTLKRFPGPRVYERLGQILSADVDGEVRRTAETVRQELTNALDNIHQEFTGRKVLLLDDEQYVISPLVDALEKRKIQVCVTTKVTELEQILQNWTPDVVVCELLDVNPSSMLWRLNIDDPPGLYLAKLVREKLGPDVPIVATSIMDLEQIAPQLVHIRSVYIRKPTTAETFVRVITSLFSTK